MAAATFLLVSRDHNDFTKPFKMPKISFEGEEDIEKCEIRYEIGKKN